MHLLIALMVGFFTSNSGGTCKNFILEEFVMQKKLEHPNVNSLLIMVLVRNIFLGGLVVALGEGGYKK